MEIERKTKIISVYHDTAYIHLKRSLAQILVIQDYIIIKYIVLAMVAVMYLLSFV